MQGNGAAEGERLVYKNGVVTEGGRGEEGEERREQVFLVPKKE